MTVRLSSLFKRALLATALLAAGHAYAASDGILVYNAQHEGLTKAWVEGFTQATGIQVTLRNGDDSEMGNQLVQEGAASPRMYSSPRTHRPWPWWTTPGCWPASPPRPWSR